MSDETAKIVAEILWYALGDSEEAIEYMIELLYKHNTSFYRDGA